MDISKYLEQDKDTLAGAVRIKGTRISAEFILELLSKGWTEADIFKNYPQVTAEVLSDIFAFARQALTTEEIISIAS